MVIVSLPAAAAAQQGITAWNVVAKVQERIGENHGKLIGAVELEQGDTKLYADEVEYFNDEDRAIATGNVVFSQGPNTIAADRADFNTKTRLGTFTNATGIANIKPPRQRPTPGAIVAPQMTGQETDVYFFGDLVEKIGPKKYKISNGGFSTCVQPTPRWDLHAGTVVLNIDHYTMLKQAIFNVKGVPMLYVPLLYYPTNEQGRATGFLIPTYGSSSVRGQSIHNAFFWAIDRSQDATFMHDWYSKTGQAFGSEYRYALATGDGNVRAQYLEDRGSESTDGIGIPPSQSYEIRGNLNQVLPGNLRARANVDYFSSLSTMQTFNTNIFDLSRNQRTYGGNLVGAWRTYTLNATFNRTQYFSSDTYSVLTGTSPRIVLSRNERPLFSGSQLYFSGSSEFVHFDRESIDETQSPSVDSEGVSRFDFTPQIRYPFKKWQWFTVNSTASWRETYYTRSLDPATQTTVDQPLNRQFFTLQAQAIGPVFSRVWDTPDNGYAEKFKHTIEPVFTAQRTTSVDNFNQIVKSDFTDYYIGTTSYTYGLNNRFYAKRHVRQSTLTQEIVTVSINQSYYTNSLAAQYDRAYDTSFNNGQPSNFSPIRADIRAMPSTTLTGTFHAEIDSHYHQLRLTTLGATYNWASRLQTTAGWTRTYVIPGLYQYSLPTNALNIATNAQTQDNRYGGRYSFNYDIANAAMVYQTITAFYNAQCCGIAFQYIRNAIPGLALPTNRQFFISFTLAGLGNFSPMNGALGGVPR
jgi:LPS-assembly protein